MLAQLRLALGIAARDTDRIARFAPAYEDLIEQLQALTSALIMYGETLGVWRDTPLAEALERQVSTAGALIRTIQAQLGDLVTGFGQARDGSALPHDDDTLGVIKAEVEALRQRLGTRPHSTLEAAAIDGVAEKALETSAAIRTVRHALATLEQPGRPVAAARSGTQIDMITGIRSPALMLQKSAIGMIALTVNSLLWIYLDWPMPSSLLVFVVVPVALNAMVPAFPLIGALKSLLVGPILAAVLYFGVMPQLDGMEQLAPILILFFFPTAYLTNSANPSTMMFGLLSSLWVVSLIDLSEGQVYSFANFANNTIGIIGGVGVGLATLAFINPPRPERQFKAHVRAFLARCERAVQDLAGPPTGRSDPGSTLHARRAEWLELLGMCELWARQLDERRHPAPERARLDAFIGTLWAFAFRLEALARACQRHPDESLIANPAARCRHAIGATLEALRKELATAAPTPSTAISTSIDDFCSALEPLHAQDHASHAIREPLHQALTLTGYYCALSDEAEACRRSAGEIDWRKWDLAYF
jgi:hypothetical protein